MSNNITYSSHMPFWQGKKVFITGHTGFKGSWLSLWLQMIGSEVIGFSLPPPTNPNLFTLANVSKNMTSIIGNVCDYEMLRNTISRYRPEIVIHMAAQSLVRHSYHEPIETYETNVMGTVHLLESIRHVDSVKSVLNVTTDKCYENNEWCWGYRENDKLGGYDPYSNSKACSEFVTSAYRNSFYLDGKVGLATVRAGNVIGGGDWAKDRLIPDIIRAALNEHHVIIRNLKAQRPWQHVLEPLSGYLLLAQRLFESPIEYADSWNFGPDENDIKTVEYITDFIAEKLGNKIQWEVVKDEQHHEATFLKLDCAKAKMKLSWSPRWSLEKALQETLSWYQAYDGNHNMQHFTFSQIERFMYDSIEAQNT